jgi:hypothetical protein
MGARIGIGVAIGATLALNCSTVAAAPDDAHDLGMEETASAGMAYSTTIHLATTFGVEAAVRWRAWKLGGFAQYAVGTYGNATSFGARLGPSLPVGPLELDVAPTIAWHRHFDVGAVHWPSDTLPDVPCSGYGGVEGRSIAVGLALDLHRPPVRGAGFYWALSALWSHDLHRTHVVETGSASCETTPGFAVNVDTTVGGETFGVALRFGLDVG